MAAAFMATASSLELRAGSQPSSPPSKNCSRMGVVLPAAADHLQDAVSALSSGQVIAVPTDTLYGFAADACSAAAVQRIYAIKGRSGTNPLALCLAHLEDLEKYSVISYLPKGLLEELFPGPVTAVLQRGELSLLDNSLNPGLASIGIRIPDSDFIRQVAEAFGGGLALTSANLSGQSSTICIQEFEQLWPHCAFIFDAGELPDTRAGSTIVDLTIPGIYKILREGSALESTVATLRRFGLTEAAL